MPAAHHPASPTGAKPTPVAQRIRIQLPLGRPSQASAVIEPARASKKVPTSKRGLIKIYGAGPYTLSWHEPDPNRAAAPGKRAKMIRCRLKRTRFADAKRAAEEKEVELLRAEHWRKEISENEFAMLRRSLEILTPLQKPLELAVAEYVSIVKMLPEGTSAQEAIKFFIENRPRDTVPKNIPDLIEELLATLKPRWARTLRGQLNIFFEPFAGPLHALRSADFNRRLSELKAEPRARLNYRTAAVRLVSYAKANGYLVKTWDEVNLKDVPAPDVPDVRIKTYSPKELVKLLAHTLENMIPFTACQSFAGVRHEELNPEQFSLQKIPLDWKDIRWEEESIYIGPETAKTGRKRIVPMSKNLIAWLKPHAKDSGPICTVSNTSNALWRAKHRAGLPCGKNESRNILRKTFISARLAIVKHIGQVAEEAGNSPAKIKSNYLEAMSLAAAERVFEIWPTTAEVLQIKFAL